MSLWNTPTTPLVLTFSDLIPFHEHLFLEGLVVVHYV